MPHAAGLFNSPAHAHEAIDDLVKNGFDRAHISLVTPDDNHASRDRTATAAAAGGLVGGAGALIASTVSLAVPVIGPILAAGPLLATLAGIGAGAAAGSILSALTQAGLSDDDAQRYHAALERGQTLVLVNSDDPARALSILQHHGAVDSDALRHLDQPPTPSETPIAAGASSGASFDSPHLAGGVPMPGEIEDLES